MCTAGKQTKGTQHREGQLYWDSYITVLNISEKQGEGRTNQEFTSKFSLR